MNPAKWLPVVLLGTVGISSLPAGEFLRNEFAEEQALVEILVAHTVAKAVVDLVQHRVDGRVAAVQAIGVVAVAAGLRHLRSHAGRVAN